MTSLVDRLFLAHPRSAGQGYLEHLRFAWSVATTLACGAVAAFLHGIFPFVLKTTAGDRIRALHAQLHARSDANPDPSRPH
jgi:hypothetical protein